MKERIRKIMESLNMTQQTFSQFLGISSAALSSMYNGRTRPTHVLTDAIHAKLPNINMMWVLYGEGEMYVDKSAQQASPEPVVPKDNQLDLDFDETSSKRTQTTGGKGRKSAADTEYSLSEMKIVDRSGRHITEIKVYYDDLTYESFVPAKSK